MSTAIVLGAALVLGALFILWHARNREIQISPRSNYWIEEWERQNFPTRRR